MSAAKRWVGRVYLGRAGDGRELYAWVGRFPTKRARDAAVAARRAELQAGAALATTRRDDPAAVLTCAEYADDTLRRMETGELRRKGGRRFKDSSVDATRAGLRRFLRDFGDVPLAQLAAMRRGDARRWAERPDVKAGTLAAAVTLLNRATEEDEYIDRNPFRGLGRRTVGRSKTAPPTAEEFERLLEGCSALKEYAPQMRALITFAAYTGMRPGELFALEHEDIDLPANRVHVARRVYKGRLDIPKSNEARTIALPPPARDALLRQRPGRGSWCSSPSGATACRNRRSPATGGR